MSSPAEPITSQELTDLLSKFSSEKTRIQAVFTSPKVGLFASVCGFMKSTPDGRMMVIDGEDGKSPQLVFSVNSVSISRYADERATRSDAEVHSFFTKDYESTITLLYGDKSAIMLMEIKDTE